MGFWSDVKKAWKTSQAERKFKKQFNSKPVSPELLSEKDAFTARGEPWVGILRMEVDPNNLSDGVFELDWNPIFVAKLVRAGYRGNDDKAIVDQWFSGICQSIVAENYENEMADPDQRKRILRKQIENGKVEVS